MVFYIFGNFHPQNYHHRHHNPHFHHHHQNLILKRHIWTTLPIGRGEEGYLGNVFLKKNIRCDDSISQQLPRALSEWVSE